MDQRVESGEFGVTPESEDEASELAWGRGEKVALVRYNSWRESRRAAILALQRRRAVVGLIGPDGIGKSTMLERLEDFLHSRQKKVVIQNGMIDLDRVPEDATLLIDDADELAVEDFEQLGTRPDLGFVLAGDKRLTDVVRTLTRREQPLAGRLRIISLQPVIGNDLHAYVEARLPKRRRWRWEFEPEVVALIAEHSLGIPRRLNELIDGAAAWAEFGKQKLITLAMVEQAASGEIAPEAETPAAKRALKASAPRKKSTKPTRQERSEAFLAWLRPAR